VTGNGTPDPAELDTALVDREWSVYIEPLRQLAARHANQLTRPGDPQLRQEYYQAIFSQLVGGYLALLNPQPRYPDFWPYTTTGLTATLNNPDANYYLTPIEEDGVYQVSGFRGTVHKIDVQAGGGRWLTRGVVGDMEQSALRSYDLDQDAYISPDGSFTIILSKQRPDDCTGDWWPLNDRTTYLMVRQISYDWFGEADGRLAIDRLDVPAARPRRSAAELEADLGQLATWTEGNVIATLGFAELARKNKVNRLENLKLDIDANGFFGKPDQFYAYGGFELGSGEALLIEAPVPEKVGYWNIQVGDDLGFTWDWMSRQTSLNGFTTVIDDDRVARFVISAEDPGVPNWLDTMGYLTGTICSRWEACSAPPAEYRATKVAMPDLRQHLPPNTPVISAGDRDAAIRRRRRGAQLRKRW
jgi:hypothetical protein